MSTTLELQVAQTNTNVQNLVNAVAGLPAAIVAALSSSIPTPQVDFTPVLEALTPIAAGIADIQAQVDQPADTTPAVTTTVPVASNASGSTAAQEPATVTAASQS